MSSARKPAAKKAPKGIRCGNCVYSKPTGIHEYLLRCTVVMPAVVEQAREATVHAGSPACVVYKERADD